MIVRKCNVCGKVYDEPWSKDRTEKVAEMTIYAVPVPVEESDRVFPRTDNNKHLDLCPECLQKVEDLIEVLKSGEKYLLIVDPDKYDFILREE